MITDVDPYAQIAAEIRRLGKEWKVDIEDLVAARMSLSDASTAIGEMVFARAKDEAREAVARAQLRAD